MRPKRSLLSDQEQRHVQNGWANLAGLSPPVQQPSIPEPAEVRVVAGNKHMMADEGISVPSAVDDYMRKMEVGHVGSKWQGPYLGL